MKIVVGYVVSDESKAALDWAIELAKKVDGHIVVTHSIRGGYAGANPNTDCQTAPGHSAAHPTSGTGPHSAPHPTHPLERG